jgi:hypothetical protein
MPYYNTTERQLRLRITHLHCIIRRWRAIALMLVVLLLACVIVIVLQYQKLP